MSGSCQKLSPNDVAEIIRLYSVECVSMDSIAQHFNVSYIAIHYHLVKNHIALRNRGFSKGHMPWSYGKHITDATKAKIIAKMKGIRVSPLTEFKLGHSNFFKGKHLSMETRLKMSIISKKRTRTLEYRTKQSEWMKGKKLHLGKHHSTEAKAKISAHGKLMWENPEYRTRVSAAIMKGLNLKPNKAEQRLDDILYKRFPDEWKYVGDGQINVGGRFPDFINVNGKKRVIEMFGSHWHPIFDVAATKQHYRIYGFEVAIIWEDELIDEDRLIKTLSAKFHS